eukprot:2694829-Rhodomonas_salina.1
MERQVTQRTGRELEGVEGEEGEAARGDGHPGADLRVCRRPHHRQPRHRHPAPAPPDPQPVLASLHARAKKGGAPVG